MLCIRKKFSTSAEVHSVKVINNRSGYYLLVFFTAFILLHTFSLKAQVAAGGTSESYLLRDVGVRPIAMAGAYTAVSNEPMGIFYNPAGLSTFAPQPKISTMYSMMEFGRTHAALAYGQSFLEHTGIGIAFNNFTTASVTSRDVHGNPIGEINDWQFSLAAGGAYSFEFASVGLAVKYLSHSYGGDDARADGFAFDLGTTFNVMDMFNFGLSIQNISGLMYWNTQSKENNLLPYTIRTGIATEYSLNDKTVSILSNENGVKDTLSNPPSRYVLFALDAVYTQYENSPTFKFGIEAVPNEVIAFRGGIALAGDKLGQFQLFPMTEWGLGVSIRPIVAFLPFDISIDYSISGDILSKNGIANHLSIFFEFY